MRVLQLLPGSIDYPSLRLMAQGLRREGVEISFASLHGTDAPVWALESGINVVDMELRSRRRARVSAGIARLLRRRRPDIAHTHLLEASVATAMIAPFMSPKLVHTRHHLDEHWHVGNAYYRALDRFAVRRADRVVAPSEAVRDFLVTREGADGSRIDVVRPCYDFDGLSPRPGDRESARSELGLEEAYVVGCVSRFISFKGHDDLVAAAAELVQAVPRLRLLLVGPGPQEHVRDLARGLGIEDRLVLTGPRTDVTRMYAAMDVFVQPSHSEAASQVVVEAMGAGKPVISTSVGGIPESFSAGSGILVPPQNPAAIAAEISRVHARPSEAAAMGRIAKATARERFVTDHAVGAQLACYQEALG